MSSGRLKEEPSNCRESLSCPVSPGMVIIKDRIVSLMKSSQGLHYLKPAKQLFSKSKVKLVTNKFNPASMREQLTEPLVPVAAA